MGNVEVIYTILSYKYCPYFVHFNFVFIGEDASTHPLLEGSIIHSFSKVFNPVCVVVDV
jgi:hypothetical protein